MKNAAAALALATLFVLSACGGGGTSAGSGPSEAPAASSQPTDQASAAPADAGSASSAPGGTETPEPTPTPNPNLLSFFNGTRVVAYPADLDSDPDDLAAGDVGVKDGAKGPFVFVYELPSVQRIDAFTVNLGGITAGGPARTATIATSTTSATDGFSDVGHVSPGDAQSAPVINLGHDARWVRLTYDAPDMRGFEGLSASGAMPGPRTGPAISQIFIEHNHPYAGGKDNGAGTADDPWYVRTTTVGDGLTLFHCYSGKAGVTTTGTVRDGRYYDYKHDGQPGRLVINDEGTQMVGNEGSGPLHYTATTTVPKYCVPDPPTGNGKNQILVLDTTAHSQPYPLDGYDEQAKPYTFTRVPAGFVDAALLADKSMVILNGLCDASDYLAPSQGRLLDDFVASGHKLAIYNADMCGDKTAYDFLPYQFTTSNPGAGGAHGDRLIEVESDDLGAIDKADAKRFLDALAYAKNDANQIGDANTVTSMDDHWCGHLFGTNSKHVNGFMQMYALYGKGVFIFGGFDEDDSGLPQYQRMRDLELGLTLPADLPCDVKVDMSFVLQPSQEARFVAGKAQTLPFDMEVLANQGWKGHVSVAATGSFPTTVTPAAFDIDGTTQPLKLAVSIPANTPAGTYTVTVTASDATGKTSQAVVTFNGDVPLKKIPKKQRRIRLYGIHFDTASAKIQPRSEPVIKEIADLMKSDKTLRFQVEGHTDSDGGAAYNLALSQARAKSVVADLIHRYHIAASRLVPKGFGLTRPVASNDTAGGKALNRRVELLRL